MTSHSHLDTWNSFRGSIFTSMQNQSSIRQFLTKLYPFLKNLNFWSFGLVCKPKSKFGSKMWNTMIKHCLQQKIDILFQFYSEIRYCDFCQKHHFSHVPKFCQKWPRFLAVPHKVTLVPNSTLIGLSNSVIKFLGLSGTIWVSDPFLAHWERKNP